MARVPLSGPGTAPARPSVSVVVAAHDAEATLDECIRSLLALRYPREGLELVVVDNASHDRTREVVERFAGEVALVEEARRGPSAARNAGIRRSRGEVIAITDADCTVDPGWLAALVEPLRDPSVGIAGGTILARRPANAIELYGEVIHDHRRAIEVFRPPYAITMSWAARSELFDEVGLFDEALLRVEDVDFAYRVGRAGYRLAFCPDAVVYHRNERTLAGLALEGWAHGFHAVPVRRRHAAYIEQARRGATGGTADGGARRAPACDAAFRLGKLLGKTARTLALSS